MLTAERDTISLIRMPDQGEYVVESFSRFKIWNKGKIKTISILGDSTETFRSARHPTTIPAEVRLSQETTR